jgi:hypothetical protein
MSLIKQDPPHTAGIIVEMRTYAKWKGERNRLIIEGLEAEIPVWRIASEMNIDRKTIFKIRKEQANSES